MNYTNARKLFLKGFLGFLILTAVMAIISILTNTFGELQAKILATSSIISAASILSMACAAFLERKKLPWLGFAGIAMAVAAALVSIVAIWAEIDNRELIRVIMTLVVAAVGFAHGFLLVLPSLDRNQQWIQKSSSVIIATLAIMLIAIIWGDFESEWYARVLSVMGILAALVTLTVPLMMKLRKENSEHENGDHENSEPGNVEMENGAQESIDTQKTLTLKKTEDGFYIDSEGNKYRVEEVG